MTRRGLLSSSTISSMRMSADDLRALRLLGQELVHLGDGSVERHDGEAVVVHVQDEILAHDGQANQRDVAFGSMVAFSEIEPTPYSSLPPPPEYFWGANQPVCRAFSILVFRRQFRRVLTDPKIRMTNPFRTLVKPAAARRVSGASNGQPFMPRMERKT